MIITKTCNTCEHYPNDKHCIGCEWDKSKGENTKWELKENPVIIERAVLDKIRDEIESISIVRDEYSQRQNDYCDGVDFAKKYALHIIDKYTSESEDNNGRYHKM